MEMSKYWYGEGDYDIPPPPMTKDDPGYAGKDRRYANLDEANIPLTECLKDLSPDSFLWEETIAPQIKSGKQVLIAAHGNSLRALIKYLDGVTEDEIIGMNVPTGMPLVYDLDENLKQQTASIWVMLKKLQRLWKRLPTKEKRNRKIVLSCPVTCNLSDFVNNYIL